MKKRVVASLMSIMLGGVLLMTGCSMEDLTDSPKVIEEEPEEDDEDEAVDKKDNSEEEEAVVDMTVDEQIALIESLEDMWIPADKDGYSKCVAVTDLDCDGRLEVIAATSVNAAANDFNFRIYEVDNAGTGMQEMEISFEYSESMPDINMNQLMQCAVSTEDGSVMAYVLSDSLMFGYSNNVDRKFVMTVEDNKVDIKKIAYADFKYDASGDSVIYYGRSDNITSAADYENAENLYLNAVMSGNYKLEVQALNFISIVNRTSKSELAAAYSMYKRFADRDEYWASFNDGSFDDYPEGWVPNNYSGETRYSALGSLEMINTSGSILTEFMWKAVEIHDSNSIYLYDYRDEMDCFDACLMSFSYDGTGVYSDINGMIRTFEYEVYSTELFSNVAITFEDATYAYAFSYYLYEDGSDIPYNCLIVSFDDAEIYFLLSAE